MGRRASTRTITTARERATAEVHRIMELLRDAEEREYEEWLDEEDLPRDTADDPFAACHALTEAARKRGDLPPVVAPTDLDQVTTPEVRDGLRGNADDASDAGMSTVEYAVGTVVAAAFAAVLYRIVTGDSIVSGLTSLVESALNTTF